MVVQVSTRTINGQDLKLLLFSGVAWLSQHVDTVNQMNVFPVPDGDTGINMFHTLNRAYQEIQNLETEDVSIIARRFAHGALMGARGNSGTILSQLLKGFADNLNDHENLTADKLLSACQNGVKIAYQSVQEPIEGTILTVAREAVEALAHAYQSDMLLADGLDMLVDAAQKSLNNTPNLLPILKKAGVVDSGGMGLFYFLKGMARLKDGESAGEVILPTNTETLVALESTLEPEDAEGYGYDVQFLMLGQNMNVQKIRTDIENMGWSTLVVGDETTIKVHVHVHNPAEPIDYAIQLGVELDDIVVENMQRQYHDYVRQRTGSNKADYQIPAHGIAVIAVGAGDGIHKLLQELHATHIISGGQTMNPSTEDFLNVLDTLPAENVILLPNNRNIILTAEQTAKLAQHKTIRVIPTRSIQQGINALIVYGGIEDETIRLDEMVDMMQEAIERVVSIEITHATRSAEIDGQIIEQGQFIGLVDGKLLSADDSLDTVVDNLFEQIKAEQYEIVTLYYGETLTENDALEQIERLSNAYKGLEFEAVYGGQPLYPYLISVE